MIKSHLSKINRTSQYNRDRSSFLRLDANERVIPFNKKTVNDLKRIINNNILQSYPSNPKKLVSLIAKNENINKKYISLVPGSDSAIKYMFEIFSGTKSKVITLSPTYGMINVYSKIYQLKLIKVYENEISKKFFSNAIYKKSSFLYIANPNQPSGWTINKKLIHKIIKKAYSKKKYIIVDEAYIDFSKQESCTKLVNKYKNLIILKTFSKSMGIAGLRIGYIICHPNISKMINSVRSIFDISHFSIEVAEYFLKRKSLLKDYLSEIKKSKKFVEKECLKRNLNFLNTDANFFHIFLSNKKIKDISNFLSKKKILVKSKHSKGFDVLKNSLRMTYGSRKQMSYFFKQFDKVYYN